jgi:hypothetical protein
VLRRAAVAYLRSRRRRAIAEQYRVAYAGESGSLAGFEGWEDEGQWPER